MEALLLAIPLPKPKRDRTDVLQAERLSARRHPLRPKRNKFPCRSLYSCNDQLLVMSLEPSSQTRMSCERAFAVRRAGRHSLRVDLYQESWGIDRRAPILACRWRDRIWLGEEFTPGLAGGVDDIVVGLEDEVREPVAEEELPDVSTGSLARSRGLRRGYNQGSVVTTHRLNREGRYT